MFCCRIIKENVQPGSFKLNGGKTCKTTSILRLNPTILVITVHSVQPNSVIIKEFKVPLIVCFDLFTPRWLSLRLKKPRNYALHPVSQTIAHQQPTTAGWRWQCPLLQTARQNVWPTAVQLHTKLCGSKEELEKMAKFILQTGRQLRRKWKNKRDQRDKPIIGAGNTLSRENSFFSPVQTTVIQMLFLFHNELKQRLSRLS